MGVEVATSSTKSLQRATVSSTFSAEVPPKRLCWCQQQYTMRTVRRLLYLEEPVYFITSRPVNSSLRLNISLRFAAVTILLQH